MDTWELRKELHKVGIKTYKKNGVSYAKKSEITAYLEFQKFPDKDSFGSFIDSEEADDRITRMDKWAEFSKSVTEWLRALCNSCS